MSCGCKGAQAGATPQAAVAAQAEDVAGKAQISYQIVANVNMNPCVECAKNGEKPFGIQFSATTGMSLDKHAERVKIVLAGIQAAAEAAKAAHEAH